MNENINRAELLGIKIDIVDKKSALERIQNCVEEKKKLHIITVNAEMMMLSKENKDFFSMLQNAGLVIPDGSGVVWALRKNGVKVKKLAGIELAESCIKELDAKIYFFGGKEETVKKAFEKFQESEHKSNIIGYRNGYFTFEDEGRIIEEINSLNPDILLIGLGVPKQEKWIVDNINKLNASVFMGVGGSFDVFSGNIKRAPLLMQKLHLEWLYRFYKEPWRWRRMLVLPKFVGTILKDK